MCSIQIAPGPGRGAPALPQFPLSAAQKLPQGSQRAHVGLTVSQGSLTLGVSVRAPENHCFICCACSSVSEPGQTWSPFLCFVQQQKWTVPQRPSLLASTTPPDCSRVPSVSLIIWSVLRVAALTLPKCLEELPALGSEPGAASRIRSPEVWAPQACRAPITWRGAHEPAHAGCFS